MRIKFSNWAIYLLTRELFFFLQTIALRVESASLIKYKQRNLNVYETKSLEHLRGISARLH